MLWEGDEQQQQQQQQQQKQQKQHQRKDGDNDVTQWDFGAQRNVYQCTLLPGETIYIPPHWPHATMNFGDTISRSQRAGFGTVDPDVAEEMEVQLDRWANAAITPEFERYGRFGLTSQGGRVEYVHLSELLNSNALKLICNGDDVGDVGDVDDGDSIHVEKREDSLVWKMLIYKSIKTIVENLNRLLRIMVGKIMETTSDLSSFNVRDTPKVRKHIHDSHFHLRTYKTKLGACYIQHLFRKLS